MLEQTRFSWLTLLLPSRVPADEMFTLATPTQDQANLSPDAVSEGKGKSSKLELESISHLFGRIDLPAKSQARRAGEPLNVAPASEYDND